MSLVDSLAGKCATPTTTKHEKTRAPETPPLELTGLGDLLAEPDETVDWLVDGLIPAGSVCLMVAKPKVGKSTLARHLALAHARGDTWLGRWCSTGNPWYLGFEGRRRDARKHFRQMGATTDDPVKVFIGQAPKNIVAAVLQRAKRERPTLVIIDTMQRFLRAQSTDDYAEMTTLFDAVLGIVQQSGATLLLLHHASKADRANIDAVLGSTAITGSVDNIILLSRTARYRTIATVQRVGDDLEERVLLLDPETGRLRLGGSREAADRDHTAGELMRVLDAAGGALTREEWFDRVEIRRALKVAALRDLEAGNNIQREGTGTRNNPYRYRVASGESCSGLFLESRNKKLSSSSSSDSLSNPESFSCSRIPAQEPLLPIGQNREPSDDDEPF